MRETPSHPVPERTSVSVAEARELVLRAIRPLGPVTVGLAEAGGRVLAEDVESGIQIPPADNSAMDGFALRAEDTAAAPTRLRVVEDLPAGARSQRKLGPGEAARIMTGAAIPEGADAVVMIEDTDRGEREVEIRTAARPGQHIRPAGGDVRPGTPIGVVGDLLRPALVGMLAAIGRTSLAVFARPRVAVLATGDELVEPDRLSDDGRIVSSNSWALCAALREIGAEPVYLGIAPDTPEAIRAHFERGLRCDAVISTGGVSVGDRDWIKSVLAGLGGEMRLWRVNMKPGAPVAFVVVDGVPVFGLPGNPVSTLVTFEQFVRPALLAMGGRRERFRAVERCVLEAPYEKAAGRMHFVRVTLARRDGVLHARPTGEQGSNLLLSMVRADGLAIVDAEVEHVPAGTELPVQLLSSDELRAEPGF